MDNQPAVIILAGGIGRSFSPFITPKPLIPFLGKPILQHLLQNIEVSGLKNVYIVTNSKTQEWVDMSKNNFKRIHIHTVVQSEANGMSDALLQLSDKIENKQVIIMNAVDMVDKDLLGNFYAFIKVNKPFAAIVGKKTQTHVPAGYLITKNGTVIGIVEKPEKGKEPSDLINLVFHYVKNASVLIEKIRRIDRKSDDIYEEALNQIMKKETVLYMEYHGDWAKLKYSHNVLDVMDIFLSRIETSLVSPDAYIHPSAVITGKVYIDSHAKIQEGATIHGPAYIGIKSIIGTNSLVRQSVIEESSTIGFGSEIARSYIGPMCMLHHNFIGDSILESNVNPSWGTTTANWRIDGKDIVINLPNGLKIETNKKKLGALIAKDVFCGVNCSIMPGVTIGHNSIVYPGQVVSKSINDNITYKGQV